MANKGTIERRNTGKRRPNGAGSVCEFTDERGRKRFKVGITLPSGKQRWKRMKPGCSEAMAQDKATKWSANVLTDPDFQPAREATGESLGDWVGRWFKDRAARGIQTKVDHGRLTVHVLPKLGERVAASVTRDDLEGIVEVLDGKVQAGEIKWKTARNVWGVVSKAFDDMANAKTRAIRVRTDNPAADVRGPDRGEKTLKQYLYPSEVLAFLTCDTVPIAWRRLVALAVYLYGRLGELEALEWEDVDLDRGIIHVHRAINREDGEVKATKTDTPRKFPIEPALLPLLHAMFVESEGKGRVLALPSETNHARALRTYLLRAGVDRAELHAKGDRSRKQITAYDLRATGITWRAVRGDDPLKIMAAAGHRDFKTTQGYIREAEPLREGFGDVFPGLPTDLNHSANHSANVNPAENKCRRRDLNPRKQPEKRPDAADRVANTQDVPTTAIDNLAKFGGRNDSGVIGGQVEADLRAGLARAAAEGRWDVVSILSDQLRIHLEAAAGNVVDLARERAKR